MKVKYLVSLLFLVAMFSPSCKDDDWPPDIPNAVDLREEMRKLIQDISVYSKSLDGQFLIIPQNGEGLLTVDGDSTGSLSAQYISAIDGVTREDLFYGFINVNVPTSKNERDLMLPFLQIADNQGIGVFVTDYCSNPTMVDNSYTLNGNLGFISFAANHLGLDNIPPYPTLPNQVNQDDIHSLDDVRNYLYLIDPGAYPSKQAFLDSLKMTDYDMLIIDLYWNGQPLTATDVSSLKTKHNGGLRLVLSYVSIGEAEDYRPYWDIEWNFDPPSWILAENDEWPGNYYVQYWNPGWKEILYGSDNSYLKKVVDAGFDGAWLDGADHFEYFSVD